MKMKKTIVMAALLVAAMTANAQARFDEGTFTIQPRIGATGAQFTNMPASVGFGDKEVDATATGGFMVGVDLEYYLSDRVSLSGGLNLMQAGTGWKDFNYTEQGVNLKVRDLKVETAYLTVPVVANWYVAKGFALKAGVQAGFMTKAEVKGTISGSDGSTFAKVELSEDCKDEMEKFDLSIPVGLSYEFKFPLVIDARYNIGLTKVNKESEPGEKDCRNGVFTLTLGYKFKL